MKKILRTLILAVFVVPVMLFATACGGDYEYTPPNYEIVDGDYEFHANRGHEVNDRTYSSYFSFTYDSLQETIDEYLTRVGEEYYDAVMDYEDNYYYDEISAMMQNDNDEIYDVFGLFADGQVFTLTPDETDLYKGVLEIYGYYDMDITVDPDDGEMRGWEDDYDDSVIEYEYADGTITVTVDVAWIVQSMAEYYGIDADYDELIPALWVRFDLQ